MRLVAGARESSVSCEAANDNDWQVNRAAVLTALAGTTLLGLTTVGMALQPETARLREVCSNRDPVLQATCRTRLFAVLDRIEEG